MNLQPLFDASLAIQLHVYGAVVGFVLGTVQMVAPKGTLPHRTIGSLWVVAMIVAVVSSIFIHETAKLGMPNIKGYTFIHIFTLLGLFSIPAGLFYLVKSGPKLKKHGRHFGGLYMGGLLIAGAFAFMPGRLMYEIVFG